MRVLISGGKDFNDPQVFRRAMTVTMSEMGSDKELILLLTGPFKTNEIARQFANLAEESFRARGMKIKYVHKSATDVDWQSVDSVVSLVVPPQRNTALGYEAEKQGVDVNVFRF